MNGTYLYLKVVKDGGGTLQWDLDIDVAAVSQARLLAPGAIELRTAEDYYDERTAKDSQRNITFRLDYSVSGGHVGRQLRVTRVH